MKDFTVYDFSTGAIVSVGICQDEEFNNQVTNGLSIIEGHYSADKYYFSDGIAVLKPTYPGDDNDWDAIQKNWKFNKQAAKQRLKKKVERERVRRDLVDIIYDGKNLQADEEARANIHGKLAEIVAAQALGQTASPLIWRDSDNIIHSWTDMLAYKEWMQGLVMAIAARGTALYQSSWAHKAALQALDTASEIKNYDITTGW